MINFKAIGQRIKLLRKEKDLTQEKLAEILDISTEHLSRIETGSYRPSLALIEKISEIFEVDEQNLMFGNSSEVHETNELSKKIESLANNKKRAVSIIIDLISE